MLTLNHSGASKSAVINLLRPGAVVHAMTTILFTQPVVELSLSLLKELVLLIKTTSQQACILQREQFMFIQRVSMETFTMYLTSAVSEENAVMMVTATGTHSYFHGLNVVFLTHTTM